MLFLCGGSVAFAGNEPGDISSYKNFLYESERGPISVQKVKNAVQKLALSLCADKELQEISNSSPRECAFRVEARKGVCIEQVFVSSALELYGRSDISESSRQYLSCMGFY